MTTGAAIGSDDELSRLLFNPKDCPLDGIGPVSVSNSLVFPSDADYSESMNCNRILNGLKKNHTQGFDKAVRDTETRRAKGKTDSIYSGYAVVQMTSVVAINENGHVFVVTHSPIDTNDAHCDVQLCAPGKIGKAERNLAKTRLAEAFGPIVPPPTPERVLIPENEM